MSILTAIRTSLFRPATIVVIGLILASYIAGRLISVQAFGPTLKLATSVQPTSFSELYFKNPDTLPKNVFSGNHNPFSYHITNHEGKLTTYHVQVIQVTDGRSSLLRSFYFTLEDGQGITQSQTFLAKADGQHMDLIVEIIGKNQSIHFRSQS